MVIIIYVYFCSIFTILKMSIYLIIVIKKKDFNIHCVCFAWPI